MGASENDPRYEEIKRCLARADRAFARAGEVDDDRERLRLIEEAESWLVMAERRLARITGRPAGQPPPPKVARETRSFRADPLDRDTTPWRRMPRA